MDEVTLRLSGNRSDGDDNVNEPALASTMVSLRMERTTTHACVQHAAAVIEAMASARRNWLKAVFCMAAETAPPSPCMSQCASLVGVACCRDTEVSVSGNKAFI